MQGKIRFKNVITKQEHYNFTADLKKQLVFFDESYFSFIKTYCDAEGWFGTEYAYYWNPEEIMNLNIEYKTSEYIKNHFIFASDRCGNAFAVNTTTNEILKMPFIPMDIQYREKSFPSFSDFIEYLEDSEIKSKGNNKINKKTFGKEVFDKHPIVLGGNPNDKNNKVLISNKQHIEAVTFFNKLVKDMKDKNA